MTRNHNRNRFWIVLLIMAVAIGMAIPAAAKPPLCSEDPEHPACIPDNPPDPEPEPPTLEACTTEMTIPGKGNTRFECLWTPLKVDDGAKVATVTVSVHDGVVGPPVVIVLDDFPGDICLIEQDWDGQTGPVYEAEFDLFYDEVPPGYEAWFERSYWNFVYEDAPTEPIVGAYWCSAQDTVLETIRTDTNGTPLHFQVGFNARGGGELHITLSPEQETPTR